MKEQTNGNVSWLEFEIFSPFPWFKHAVSLNQRLSHEEWLKDFLPETVTPFSLRQVHGTALLTTPHQDQEGDGHLTKNPHEALLIRHADCQAALFLDVKERAFAAVHAGWRGEIENIYEKTVMCMQELFGSKPHNLVVGIGPSLGPLSSEFVNYEREFPKELWRYQFKPFYFDLWQMAEDQLTKLGIPKSQIEIARIDTAQDLRFHSFRRSKTALRHVTVAYI